MRKLLTGLLLLLPLVQAGCAFVPTTPNVRYGTLTVSVVDEEGTAVRGARVEVWGGLERTERRNVAETAAAGEVNFILPPAVYEVYAIPPAGYAHRGAVPETRVTVGVNYELSPVGVTLVLARTP